MKLKIRDWSVNVNVPKVKPTQVFIRFGMWSSREPSYNHVFGTKELGLSVYPARWLEGAIALDESEIEANSVTLMGRYAFPLTGRIVGYGSDGEPVLKAIRVLPYPLHISVSRRPFVDKDFLRQTQITQQQAKERK